MSKNLRRAAYSIRGSLPMPLSTWGARGLKITLDHERPSRVERRFGPVVFHALIPLFAQDIDAQAVGLRIDNVEKPGANADKLARIDQAFENRILDALTMIKARLRCPAKSAPSGSRDGGHIVGDENLHKTKRSKSLPSFPEKRRIGIKVASQVPGEKPCLQMRHNSPWDLFLKKGMDEFLSFPLLPGHEDLFARFFS